MSRPAGALLTMFAIMSCAQRTPAIEISNAWTRATLPGSPNAAVFMTISSATADRLVAASTPAARKSDLMTMEGGDSAMSMKYIPSIDLPARAPVTLNPAGVHVWLEGLKQPLRAGQTFPLNLTFEKAGKHQVTVRIVSPSAPPPNATSK